MDVGEQAHTGGSEEEDGRVFDLVFRDVFEGVVDEAFQVVGSDEFWLVAKGRDTCCGVSVAVRVRDKHGIIAPGLIFRVHFFFVSNCGRLLSSSSSASFLARCELSHR